MLRRGRRTQGRTAQSPPPKRTGLAGTTVDHGGDRMFVDHLLTTVGDQTDHEAVKAGDDALHLKAVHQKHRDELPVLPGLVQEQIL